MKRQFKIFATLLFILATSACTKDDFSTMIVDETPSAFDREIQELLEQIDDNDERISLAEEDELMYVADPVLYRHKRVEHYPPQHQ